LSNRSSNFLRSNAGGVDDVFVLLAVLLVVMRQEPVGADCHSPQFPRLADVVEAVLEPLGAVTVGGPRHPGFADPAPPQSDAVWWRGWFVLFVVARPCPTTAAERTTEEIMAAINWSNK
jgi:hypothetical protein